MKNEKPYTPPVLRIISDNIAKRGNPLGLKKNDCGAPCETIYPELSELIASRRAEELADTGAEVTATLCPFCYANLSKGADLTGKKIKIVDFIEIIYQALEANNAKA